MEILMGIFHLVNDVDSILLALSCKTLLRVATICGLQVPNPEAHRAPWNRLSRSSSQTIHCECRSTENLLGRFCPRDVNGRRSRSWALCVDCVSYRPTRKAYWTIQLTKMRTSEWDKKLDELWKSSVRWFATGVRVQCPGCRLQEYTREQVEDAQPTAG